MHVSGQHKHEWVCSVKPHLQHGLWRQVWRCHTPVGTTEEIITVNGALSFPEYTEMHQLYRIIFMAPALCFSWTSCSGKFHLGEMYYTGHGSELFGEGNTTGASHRLYTVCWTHGPGRASGMKCIVMNMTLKVMQSMIAFLVSRHKTGWATHCLERQACCNL